MVGPLKSLWFDHDGIICDNFCIYIPYFIMMEQYFSGPY